jgi:hypothetical protein
MKKISKSAQIRALYEQGMNNTQIAEALGFKRNYVVQITGNCRRLLKASGKPLPRSQGGNKIVSPQEASRQVAEAYRKSTRKELDAEAQMHGAPAYFSVGLSPNMSHPKVGDVAYVRNLKQPKKSSVLSRFWEVVRWICTGRVDL